MQGPRIIQALYRIAEWIMRFAYLNLLWISFTFVGLLFFGFFPATAAMFSIIRKWIMKDTEVAIFKNFWKTYKAEFVKSNLLGLVIIGISWLLYIDYRFFQEIASGPQQLLFYPIILVTLAAVLTSLYLFPALVHYDAKLLQIVKNAFFIMILNPLLTIGMVITLFIYCLIMLYFQGLIILFSGSLFAYITMQFSYVAFNKVQQKIEARNSAEISR